MEEEIGKVKTRWICVPEQAVESERPGSGGPKESVQISEKIQDLMTRAVGMLHPLEVVAHERKGHRWCQQQDRSRGW